MSMQDRSLIKMGVHYPALTDNTRTTTLPLGGLSRSKSFAGLLAPRRSNSTLNRESSTVSNKRSSWFGNSMNSSHSGSTLSLNTKQRGNVKPKDPRPQRTVLIVAAISQGLREAILITEEDIASLKSSLENLSLESQQQLKGAERYLKRLDFQLSALEELQESYNVQGRLREGVRAMGKAYIESLGPEREAALSNVRSGFKECNEAMCALESQLETVLGAFHIQMKGLQGFARLCPGDVFEITLRHGQQKWRTRGKVARDGTQSWDSQKYTFKAHLDELLFIRATEIRSLGKQVLLGNKYCETLELFCAQPQMMTVNLNTSGSLKLNLVVTWDPLYGNTEENGVIVKQQILSSPLHRQKSITSSGVSPLGTMSSTAAGSVTALSMASYESEGTASPDHDSGQSSSASAKSSTLNSTSPVNEYQDYIQKLNVEEEDVDITRESTDGIENIEMNRKLTSSLTDMTQVEDNMPSPDYSSDSHGSQESLSSKDDLDADLNHTATALIHEDPETMTSVRRDVTGNFLLVRRNDGSVGTSWWQQRYYSSPTHTVDSGYDGSIHARRSQLTQSQAFTEEEEQDLENELGFSRQINDQADIYENPNWAISKPKSQNEARESDWLTKNQSGIGQNVLNSMIHSDLKETPRERTTSPIWLPNKTKNHNWMSSNQNLESLLQQLKSVIADIQGQYSELETFERSVTTLFDLLKLRIQHGGSHTSLTSLMVESALECFDFLDNEESDGPEVRSRSTTPSPDKDKIFFSTQLDRVLVIHLLYCLHLSESLGAFGPLKCREKQALSKLQIQGRILNKLSKLVDRWQQDPNCTISALDELNGLNHLQKLWSMVCPGGHSLCVLAQDIYSRLLPLCRSALSHISGEMHERVMEQFIMRCQDVTMYNSSSHVSVFQFRYFVRSKERSFQTRLEEIGNELQYIAIFESQNPQHLQKTMTRLSLTEPLPNVNVLMKMSHLLLDPSDHPHNPRIMIASYFKNNAKEADLREKMLDAFMEGLESYNDQDRQGSCEALSILQAKTAVDQLAYVGQCDSSAEVRRQAKSALLAMGVEGRDVMRQLQLSSHGFQGLTVK